jgi:hypothetical protein
MRTKLVTSVEEALGLVDAFEGEPETFELAFPDSLNDLTGINMAIIGDRILGRGWWPNGFVQKPGFRIYLYKRKPD